MHGNTQHSGSQILNDLSATSSIFEQKETRQPKKINYPLKKKYPLKKIKKEKKNINDDQNINSLEILPYYDNDILKKHYEPKKINYSVYNNYEKNEIFEKLKDSIKKDLINPDVFEIKFNYLYDNDSGNYKEIEYINTYKKIDDNPNFCNYQYNMIYRKERGEPVEFSNLKRNELNQFLNSPTRKLNIGKLDIICDFKTEQPTETLRKYGINILDFMTDKTYIIYEVITKYTDNKGNDYFWIILHKIFNIPSLNNTGYGSYYIDEFNELENNKYIIMNVKSWDLSEKYTYDFIFKGSMIRRIMFSELFDENIKIKKQDVVYSIDNDFSEGLYVSEKLQNINLINSCNFSKFLYFDSIGCLNNLDEKQKKNICNYILLFGYTDKYFKNDEKKKYIKMSKIISNIEIIYNDIVIILRHIKESHITHKNLKNLKKLNNSLKCHLYYIKNNYDINDKETLKHIYIDCLDDIKYNAIKNIIDILNNKYIKYQKQCKFYEIDKEEFELKPKDIYLINKFEKEYNH